jgi:DNA repair protein RadC
MTLKEGNQLSNLVRITKPVHIYNAIYPLIEDREKENLITINLNSNCNILSIELVGLGTVNECLVHPREIFRKAIMQNATFVAIAHNHPSNNAEPSQEDITATRKLEDAGRLIGIEVLDHVIICDDEFYSIKANKSYKAEGGDNK